MYLCRKCSAQSAVYLERMRLGVGGWVWFCFFFPTICTLKDLTYTSVLCLGLKEGGREGEMGKERERERERMFRRGWRSTREGESWRQVLVCEVDV